MTNGARWLAVLGAIAVWGCSGGSEGSSSTPAIRGTVEYTGALHGPLRVAVFTSFPPRGAPIAVKDIVEPRFPQSFEVTGVPPGRYFVLAAIAHDGVVATKFRPSVDPGGAFGGYLTPQALTVDSVGSAGGVNLTLVDPSERSPWSVPGYR